MFMPKRPLSITLDEDNLLWLKGRAAVTRRRSLSDTLDEIVTAARTGGLGASASRSVANTVDIADTDPGLDAADAYIQSTVRASLVRPTVVRERRPPFGSGPADRTAARKPRRRG
jgi:hypothetical protein